LPARTGMVALGGCFSLSCISLLGDGFEHLRFFLPLAALNIVVGVFVSERTARVVLVLEGIFIFGALGYQLVQLHERFPDT
jgi:ABC-type uncharacterized transport system permease subunit